VRPDRSKFYLPGAEEPCRVARCQLCEVARVNPDFEWYNKTTRPRPEGPDRSPDLKLLKAVLQNAARATALSPLVDSKG
jgi:hypothetical protein